MPVVNNAKDLYLAHSIKELKDKCYQSLPTTNNINIIYNSLKSLLKEAHSLRMDGDEEKAFVLYFRMAIMVEKMKKTSEYKKNKANYDTMVGPLWTDSITWAENLQASLVKRYDAIRENDNSQQQAVEEDNGPKVKQEVNSQQQQHSMPTQITSTQLFDLLSDSTSPLLIIDTRLPGEFDHSTINHPSCFNIPENLLVPGLTAHQLEPQLTGKALQLWNQRGSVDFVVLMDWNSTEKALVPGSPIHCLREAMCKWDSQKILKSDPLILEGGYLEFVDRFPTVTTCSKVVLPPRLAVASPSSTTSLPTTVIYPSLDEEDNQRLGPTRVDRASKPVVQPPEPQRTPLQHSVSAPAEAPSKPPSVNRALKPPTYTGANLAEVMSYVRNDVDENMLLVQEQLEKEREFEKLRERREREAEEGMRQELLKQEKVLKKRFLELEAEAKQKEEEHQKALEMIAHMKKDLEASAKRITELEDLQNIQSIASEKKRLQQEVIRMREERKRKEKEERGDTPTTKLPPQHVDKTPAPVATGDKAPLTKRSLSRSHSSPNIAQMMAEEESNTGTTLPHFDRSLKPVRPSETTTHNWNLEDNRSAAMTRTLNPIYGSAGRAVTGLRNLGNTCFMNSIIQCLSATTPLASYFYRGEYMRHLNRTSKQGTGGDVLEEFVAVIKALWVGQYRSITPRDFKNTVSKYISVCAGHDQQDAHEFLVVVMEKMHWDLNQAKHQEALKPPELEQYSDSVATEKFWNYHRAQHESIFVELFEGLLRSTLTCMYCHKVSNSYEVFSSLSLPLPSGPKVSRTSLKECLNLFLKTERISGESGWNCPQCKMKQEAEKKMVILKLPKILIFHLKRFSYDGLWRQKLQTMVDFPIQNLDMNPYVFTPRSQNTYHLYGVVNHFGTLEGGHYISHCKNSVYHKWYKFDDQEVSELNLTEVRNPTAAYLLFYSRIELDSYL